MEAVEDSMLASSTALALDVDDEKEKEEGGHEIEDGYEIKDDA